ncbi:MAG: ABC transporter substrate binding protein [Pseudomonadota bacterium]
MRAVLRLILVLMLFATNARADIIVLASDDKGAVAAVTAALQSAHGARVEVHNLAGGRGREADIVQAIRASPINQVVAVGLLAAQVARQRLDGKQVVFCQVLNVEEFKLVAPWMKGVSGIPSLARQFAAWKTLDPNLRKIGLITGQHAGYMVDEAEAAAKPLGLEIEHVAVSSDRAVLSALHELRERRVGGLWLAPDSSILSQRAILDLMASTVRHKLPVLAFSPALLKEGALLSATADNAEIASLTLERLRKAGPSGSVPGEALAPLDAARITVSAAAAARFGLAISSKLKEQADVQ